MSIPNDQTKSVIVCLTFLFVQFANFCAEEIEFYAKNYDSPTEKICSNEVCSNGIFKWHRSKTKTLHVGGIFPMVGGWPGGQSCLPSAIMALNQVNLNKSMLPNYRLKLNWFNSEVLFSLNKKDLI